MTLNLLQAWQTAKERLTAAGLSAPVIDSRLMVEAAADATRADIVTDPYRPLTPEQEATLADYLDRREKREPVSHILGRKGFWKIMLSVTPDVLTPRPDTEVIVDYILKGHPEGMAFNILDLGVGSGAIILSILGRAPSGQGSGHRCLRRGSGRGVGERRQSRPCVAARPAARRLDGRPGRREFRRRGLQSALHRQRRHRDPGAGSP